jgi:hypothetical protein
MNGSRWIPSLILALVVLFPTAPRAQTKERPLQISVFAPVQIVKETESIKGVRLNLVYGKNVDVRGLDIDLIVAHNTGLGRCVQWNLVNLVEGGFLGWQAGAVNLTKSGFVGLQTGLFNRTQGSSEGFQWGWINVSEDFSGVMLAFVNYAENLDGIQIGLINIIKSKDKLPVFPIVNWKF